MSRLGDLFSLEGKAAVVTGAGRGLGRSIAIGLAEAGADVALVARSTEQLAEVKAEVESRGRRCSAHPTNLREVEKIPRVVEDVMRVHGRVDVLINNAGAKVVQPILEVSETDWDLVLDTNLKAAFFCSQAVAAHMSQRGSGKIINMASTYAVVGASGRASYAASKGGLLQLTRAMAAELASHGINVNAIGPTSASTPMNEALFSDPEWRAEALKKIPAGRFLDPQDVLGAVVFLASNASNMVHGQLLLVDGGFTAV